MARKPVHPCIVWFRDDLRVSDHPALHAASKTGRPVICLYVFDEESNALRAPNARPLGGAARWWLARSLRALQNDLNSIGSSLVLRKGPVAKIIAGLARETHAGAAFWNEIAQAPYQTVADQVAAALKEIGVTSQGFPGDLLVHPANIRNKENRGLRVFTPFWRRVQASGDPPKPLPAPRTLYPVPNLASDTIESWHLEPAHPDWARGLRDTWTPGEVDQDVQGPAAKGQHHTLAPQQPFANRKFERAELQLSISSSARHGFKAPYEVRAHLRDVIHWAGRLCAPAPLCPIRSALCA